MMHCPVCRHAAHARSSRYLSEKTKERYYQCRNINCSCTFVTMESVERHIMTPGEIIPVPPHPAKEQQIKMSV